MTVTESEIVEAMRLLWGRMKVVIEPSGAVEWEIKLQDRALASGLDAAETTKLIENIERYGANTP